MSVNEADRVVLNKVYVGRAALFGLIYGLVFGLIAGVFAAISIVLGSSSFSIPGVESAGAFMVFIAVVIFYTLSSLVGFAIGALLYNLIALVGVKMHFNLGKYMIASSAKVAVKSKGVRPAVVKDSSSAGVQVK
jgi:hypothetical protein